MTFRLIVPYQLSEDIHVHFNLGPPRQHDSLCVQTIFNTVWEGGKSVPSHLKLQKLPMPFPDTEATPVRTRKVRRS